MFTVNRSRGQITWVICPELRKNALFIDQSVILPSILLIYIILKLESMHYINFSRTTHVKTHNLSQTCSRLVASLLQQLLGRMCSHWLSQACWQGCYKPAADLLQAWWTQQPCYKFVPTTCYWAASQQLVNKLWVTNLVQLDKITALLRTCWQACYKLVASTTCWQVVRFYVCSTRSITIPSRF